MVGSGTKYRKLNEMKDKKQVVSLVSPIAQATEMADSEMKRERKKENSKNVRRPLFLRYNAKWFTDRFQEINH